MLQFCNLHRLILTVVAYGANEGLLLVKEAILHLVLVVQARSHTQYTAAAAA